MAETGSYFSEFRLNWRYLASSTLGVAFGYGINNYLNNLFIPPLMAEFGWQKSVTALIGVGAIASLVCQPVAGRLTDRFGVRVMASFGVSCATLIFVALSFMTGNFLHFFLLNAAQIALVAATTGPVVYSRLIAQTFDKARGVALAITTCAHSVAALAVVPIMTTVIENDGWRAGYLVAAAGTAVAGAIAILLIPASPSARAKQASSREDHPTGLGVILRDPSFRLIVAGIALCSLTILMQTTQLKVILLEAGLTSRSASYLIMVYAVGVIVGRLSCGIALDRFPAYLVAAISLSLPGIGLVLLATGLASPLLMGSAVVLLGLALGAEGDIAGYLTMTYFRVEVYSMVVGFIVGTLSFSGAMGALILAGVLQITNSFAPFLLLAAVSSIAGASMFLRLKRLPRPS